MNAGTAGGPAIINVQETLYKGNGWTKDALALLVFLTLHGKPARTAVQIPGPTIIAVRAPRSKEKKTKKDAVVLLAITTMNGLQNMIAPMTARPAAMGSV